MARTVSEKMGVEEGVRAIFVNAPETALRAIDPPDLDVAPDLAESFDYIHLFAKSRAELDDAFPKLKAHLEPTGMLWACHPCGTPASQGLCSSLLLSNPLAPWRL